MENVTRRKFLGGTAGAIASGVATGTALQLPTSHALEGPDKSSSLKETASALHDAIGRYSDRHAPVFSQPRLPPANPSLDFAMENLRYWSVDEIQHLLKPLFEGGAK